jgi:hypothetical protein
LSATVPWSGFAHAAETFLFAHTTSGAWSAGIAVTCRQTLTALAARLAEAAPPVAADIATLDTPAGAKALAAAWAAAFGHLAPATRARHLAALRSAITSWCERGWLAGDEPLDRVIEAGSDSPPPAWHAKGPWGSVPGPRAAGHEDRPAVRESPENDGEPAAGHALGTSPLIPTRPAGSFGGHGG